jgi:prepilin-type N-terminal cleavage/methylation domain-containing protein
MRNLSQKRFQAGKTKLESGFTIIEVLIVLAIAALILLIVFLAVPALQRNQRNTSRQSDLGRLGAAVTSATAGGNVSSPLVCADRATIRSEAGTMAQYTSIADTGTCPGATTANNVMSLVAAGAGSPVALPGTAVDTIQIVTGGVCVAGGGATNVGASAKNVAFQFVLETSAAANNPQCRQIN